MGGLDLKEFMGTLGTRRLTNRSVKIKAYKGGIKI